MIWLVFGDLCVYELYYFLLNQSTCCSVVTSIDVFWHLVFRRPPLEALIEVLKHLFDTNPFAKTYIGGIFIQIIVQKSN